MYLYICIYSKIVSGDVSVVQIYILHPERSNMRSNKNIYIVEK